MIEIVMRTRKKKRKDVEKSKTTIRTIR